MITRSKEIKIMSKVTKRYFIAEKYFPFLYWRQIKRPVQIEKIQRPEIKINLTFNEAPITDLAIVTISNTRAKTDILAICILFSFRSSSFFILPMAESKTSLLFIFIIYL
jgi:hypothetical protein